MMKLWCLLVVLLLVPMSIAYIYSDQENDKSNRLDYPIEIPLNSPSIQTRFVSEDRLHVKRSQRNANILYRYCRQSGQARQFCLKYAIRMIFATGH